MIFKFQTINRIVYGEGAVQQLGAEVARLKGKRVMVITDKGLFEHNVHLPVLQALAAENIYAEVFSDVELDPSPESIEKTASYIKDFKADVLVGLGGGSALDSTKAIALRVSHPGPIEQYIGMQLVPSACMPTVLIPTTAGTGSEMTSITILNDPVTESKRGIVSEYLYAKCVILDPALTLTLPPFYTAITGLDALVHAMESYVSVAATPFTDCVNIHAIEIICAYLRKAYAQGRDITARSQMLFASSMCGMGFSNTQNGVIHALGMAVPSHYHLPHGLMMAAVAPMGIQFNAIAAPEKYAKIAGFLGSAQSGISVLERAKSAEHGFRNLMADLNIEAGLAPYGVDKKYLKGIAELAASTRRLMDSNPRQATAQELEILLEHNY